MPELDLPHLAPHDLCTGCGACANGCPKGAIHMLPDREGFLYPTVTDACIQCGHCTHICPALKQRERRPDPMVFAAWNPDENVRRASTAGGVFTLLAEYILEDGGVVFGAAMSPDFHVHHIAVKSKEQLPLLQGAKLVQSEIGDAYTRVRYYLDQGRRVLFTGTPCQIDGLYRFLGEHPELLLTCDILCGGVPSPGVWAQMVRFMAYAKQKKPLSVTFCGKEEGQRDRYFRVTYEGGSTYTAPLVKTDYGRGLHRRLFLRPACHNCSYTCTDRVGDLSLGSYVHPPKDFFPDEQARGICLLLINSPKGAHMFDLLPLKREKLSLSEAVAGSDALAAPPAVSEERSSFFNAYSQQSFYHVLEQFLRPLAMHHGRKKEKNQRRFFLKNLFRKKK